MRKKKRLGNLGLGFLIVAGFLLALSGTGIASPMVISRASSSSAGDEGDGSSKGASVSADGRYVVFYSGASDLVPGDANGAGEDIFLKDTETGTLTMVSTNPLGEQANSSSIYPSISADGRYVSFRSWGTNLLFGEADTNGAADIFVKDLQTGWVERVSIATNGDEADGNSGRSSISADGRFVAFDSEATNLVSSAIDNNGGTDIFIHDMQSQPATTTCISCIRPFFIITGNGLSERPSISADGRYVAFQSMATNLDASDGDSVYDIYVKDTQAGINNFILASTSTGGAAKGSANSLSPSISADGQYVSFTSYANNLVLGDVTSVDIFRKSLGTGNTMAASRNYSGNLGADDSVSSAISADGRYVAFHSYASNMVAVDTNNVDDIFVKDMTTGAVSMVSTDTGGSQVGGFFFAPDISADGRHVAFSSADAGLVPGDANGVEDIFITRSGPNLGFTWYDNIGGANWVLMANPASASGDAWFDLTIGGVSRVLEPLPGYSAGQAHPGSSITPRYAGLMDGPVDVGSSGVSRPLASQRILWPSGGSSLEEVVGFDTRRVSDHFYWTWYDQLSAGFQNWVLVSNPGVDTITAQVSFRNQADGQTVSATGDIAPGESWAPTFAGKMGGPVEVRAYRQGGDWNNAVDRRVVIASQRVLSSSGTAFNEAVGVPAGELSSDYFWPWYDDAGGQNWILLANPNGNPVNFQVDIGGGCATPGPNTACLSETLAASGQGGDIRTFRFGAVNGPVHVTSSGGNIIASQRIIFGTSFGETMGTPADSLSDRYHWTWYDQLSAGMSNWVLVANPSTSDTIDVEVWIAGQQAQEGVGVPAASPTTWTLPPGAMVTPRFGMYMGGPVEVRAFLTGTSTPATDGAIVSQRVLFNGYFNEVPGAVLD